VVETFLKAQSLAGSFGADIGCGNGKYIGVADPAICPDLFYFGCDRSRSLVSIAHGLHPHANLACADILSLPYRSASFDFVLSIAVIHHLNSEDRRLQALSEMTRIARPGARILVFVWALEQKVP
jgi:tRNA (uracil-5-)-methyltransferase TRM9